MKKKRVSHVDEIMHVCLLIQLISSLALETGKTMTS